MRKESGLALLPIVFRTPRPEDDFILEFFPCILGRPKQETNDIEYVKQCVLLIGVRAVQRLMSLLESPDEATSRNAADALAGLLDQLDDATRKSLTLSTVTVGRLLDDLAATEPRIMHRARSVLIGLQTLAVKPLICHLAGDNHPRRLNAARILMLLGPAAYHAIPDLKKLQAERKGVIQEQCRAILKKIGKTVPLADLSADDPRVRVSAAESLGRCWRIREVVVPQLKAALNDSDARVRQAVQAALAGLDAPP